MKITNAWIIVAAAIALTRFNGAVAQSDSAAPPIITHISPVQTGDTFNLRVTLAEAGMSLPTATLLLVSEQLKNVYQRFVTPPITQVEFLNPNNGTVVAVFTAKDWTI